MEALMNGATILNVPLLVAVEIRCACVPVPIPCHGMEGSLAWALTLKPENAILNPAQVDFEIIL